MTNTATQEGTVIMSNIVVGIGLQATEGTAVSPTHHVNAERVIFKQGAVDEEFRGTQVSLAKRSEAVRRVLERPEIDLSAYLSESILQPLLECACGSVPIAKLSSGGVTATSDSDAITEFQVYYASVGSNIDASGKLYTSLFVSASVAYFRAFTISGMTAASMVLSGNAAYTASTTITLAAQNASGMSGGTITATLSAGTALNPTLQILYEDYTFAKTHRLPLTVVLFDGVQTWRCVDVFVNTARFSSNEGEALMGEFNMPMNSFSKATSAYTGTVSDWDFFAHLDMTFNYNNNLTAETAQSGIELEIDNLNKVYAANAKGPIKQIQQGLKFTGSLKGLLGTETRNHLDEAEIIAGNALTFNRARINYTNSQNRLRFTIGETLFKKDAHEFFGTDEIPDFEMAFEVYQISTYDA